MLVAGFIFGKWIGVLLAVSALSIGATILYIFAGYFFKDLIIEKFLSKFKNLETKFKKNEFIFFLVYRIVGGIPFPIANLLPILFNVKKKISEDDNNSIMLGIESLILIISEIPLPFS